MSNKDFYKELESVDSFEELANSSIYKEVPEDWYILASDVKESNNCIKKGKYKEINMVGAMSIIAILNIDKKIDLPFIFGGDGAFILIPRDIYKETKQALLSVKKLSKELYGLDLRVAVISISELLKLEKSVKIAKYKSNRDFYQALIQGEGLEYFDSRLKKDDRYHIKDSLDNNFILDLVGLECRWSYIKSSKDETTSLIFKCFNTEDYREVLDDIKSILGDTNSRHPIIIENLKLSFDNRDLEVEASILSKTFFQKHMTILKLKFINFIGAILMKLKVSNWRDYKSRIIAS